MENILQHKGSGKGDNDAPVQHTAFHHLRGSPQQHTHRADNGNTDRRKDHTQKNGKAHHGGEGMVRLLLIALAQLLRHQRCTAGSYHKSGPAQHHDKREHEIERRKFGLAHYIGNKQSIYYTIDGCENHHNNGRHGKADQPTVAEMVGKPDRLPCAISSLCVHLLFSSFHFLKFPAISFFAESYGLYLCRQQRILA